MRSLAKLAIAIVAAVVLMGSTAFDATTINGDNSASPLSLTSTETSVVLSVTDTGARYIQLQCSQDWGIANTACTFANKTFVPANTPYTVYLPSDQSTAGLTVYVQASSTTGVLKIRTLARAK